MIETEPAKVIAIAGGSGSGKTTLARRLAAALGPRSTMLSIDWYYRDLSALTIAQRSAVNFDDPASLELDLFAAHLSMLRQGQAVEAPTYDFATHTRPAATLLVRPAPVVVTEGILLLALPEVVEISDYRLFLDVPTELRLERRLYRDVRERGREPDDVLRQWNESVQPMYEKYVEPSRACATRVVTEHDDFDDIVRWLVVDELGYQLPSESLGSVHD